MALNASGAISLAGSTAGESIALELGESATATTTLNDSAVRTLADVSDGAIVMPTDFTEKPQSLMLNNLLGAAVVKANWAKATPLPILLQYK